MFGAEGGLLKMPPGVDGRLQLAPTGELNDDDGRDQRRCRSKRYSGRDLPAEPPFTSIATAADWRDIPGR